ncbi:ribosome small subunit-dependent GTPase A [Planctomycetota bacterium]|nr:ribosome small subunit-dependent GTPase A [Planctomycetota bacterium]
MSEVLQGTVVRLHGHHVWVKVSNGDEYRCAVRGKLKKGKRRDRSPLAVGDGLRFEKVTDTDELEGQILEIVERRTELYRTHPRFPRQRQVLAANIDFLVIVVGADRILEQLVTVDRLLISAFSQGLEPVLVVNKTDIVNLEALQEIVQPYESIVSGVYFTSAHTADLGALPTIFEGKSSVFAGMSGVGKSSLMNAIEPDLNLRVGEVDKIGEGKHTTTNASLIPLAGGLVIDTPGVRDFGFWNLELPELALYYPDFEPFREHCRFNTCTHRHEPQCAVQQAVEAEALDWGRYERYLQILRETWNELEARKP